jgi:hypothetical protein
MEPNTISTPLSQPAPQVQPQNLSLGTLEGPVSLFKSSWKFFKSNWKKLVPIIILPGACFTLGQIIILFGNPIVSILSVLLFIAGIIFSITSQPAAVDAIAKLNNGNMAIRLGEQYKFGFKIFWSMLLLGIIQALISFGASVLFVIPAIVVGIYLAMSLYVFVLEGKRGYEALTESYSLVYGRWFDVLVRLLFIALVYIGFAIIFALVSFIITTIFGIDPDSVSEKVLSLILNLVLSSGMGTLIAVYLYNIYLTLKATRRQNVDVISFKKWLVAFTVLGIVGLISLIVLLVFIFLAMGGGF